MAQSFALNDGCLVDALILVEDAVGSMCPCERTSRRPSGRRRFRRITAQLFADLIAFQDELLTVVAQGELLSDMALLALAQHGGSAAAAGSSAKRLLKHRRLTPPADSTTSGVRVSVECSGRAQRGSKLIANSKLYRPDARGCERRAVEARPSPVVDADHIACYSRHPGTLGYSKPGRAGRLSGERTGQPHRSAREASSTSGSRVRRSPARAPGPVLRALEHVELDVR